MKKTLRTMAAAALGFFCLSATAQSVDLGAIELGKVYTVPDMCAVTGTITAPTTGTLLQDGVADISLEGVDKTWAGYGDNGQVYSYQVVQGQTYTASCDFVFSGGNVVWKMQGAEALAVVEVNPREGSVLSTSVNGTGDIIIQFNAVVSVKGATLSANGQSAPLQVSGAGSVKAAVNVRSALASLYADGTLNSKGNDRLVITLNGVEDSDGNQYNGDGVLTLNYVSAPKALDLVSTDFAGRKLKSYYAANDPEGILTFVFDGQVLDNGTASLTLSCGSPEIEGAYYYEDIAPIIDGNVVKVDLSGKLRELNSYLSYSELPYVAAKLSNVRDLSGNMASGDSDQTVGSYNYFFAYDYIEPVTISSEFVPASGATLEGVDQVEIWFNNADKVQFDGVLFACPAAKVVVPMEELDITREGTDVTIVVAVPEPVKGQKGVSVTLNNMVSLDGYDHTKQVKAVYDAWVVTLVSPIQADGTYLTTGEDDFVFTMNEAYGYMRYDLYNGTEWVYGSWLNDAGDGTYTAFNGNWPLFQNMENKMVLKAYDNEGDYFNGGQMLADVTLYFNGLTEGFSYSDVKFVSIDPEAGSEIEYTEGFHFTVTFDGLVTVTDQSCVNLGFGMSSPFAKIEPVDQEETTGLSSVWALYPNSYDVSGTGIDISVYAYDIDGKLVEGNMGGNEYDYLQFSFGVYSTSNFRPVDIFPTSGSDVFMISDFEFSHPTYAVGLNYAYTEAMPFVSDKLGNTVYTFSPDDFEVMSDIVGYDEDGEPIYDEHSIVKAFLQQPIWEEGSYMLFIPEKFFLVGSQFETYFSQEVQALYTIGGGSSASFISVTPSEGENLQQLDYIVLSTNAEFNTQCEDYITLVDTNTWSNIADWSQWSSESQVEKLTDDGVIIGYKLNLESPLTQDGEYIINIPNDMFILDGAGNDWISVSFTIGEGPQKPEATVDLTLDPAPGTVAELVFIHIEAPGIQDASIDWEANVYITNEQGEVVRTVTGTDMGLNCMDWNTWEFLGYNIDLTADPITAEGVYVVEIPEGMFEFWDMSRSKALTAVYTVSSTTGVSTILLESAASYEVYTINGVKVLSTTNAAALGQLNKGLYIINGKKVLVK